MTERQSFNPSRQWFEVLVLYPGLLLCCSCIMTSGTVPLTEFAPAEETTIVGAIEKDGGVIRFDSTGVIRDDVLTGIVGGEPSGIPLSQVDRLWVRWRCGPIEGTFKTLVMLVIVGAAISTPVALVAAIAGA